MNVIKPNMNYLRAIQAFIKILINFQITSEIHDIDNLVNILNNDVIGSKSKILIN